MSEKWLFRAYVLTFFISIILFAFTGSKSVLCSPLLVLYCHVLLQNWKNAYWVMLCCIPFSFEFELLNGSLSTTLPDEPMMWGFFLLFLLMFAHKPKIIPKWWLQNPITVIVIFQFLWLMVAVYYSNVLLLSAKFLLAKCWFEVSFFILPLWVFRDKTDFRKGFKAMLYPLLATMIIITCRQVPQHFSFRQIEHAIGGLYTNHVDYSTVVSMFFPLVCVAYPLASKRSRWMKYGLIALIAFFLFVVLFTYARAASLAVVFALFIGLAIRMRFVNLVMPAAYGIIALGLVYMIKDNKFIDFRPNYERTYMHSSYIDHIMATFRGQDMSSMERLHRWIAAMRMSREEPLTGYGPHAFDKYYQPFTITKFKTYVSANPEHSTTHNYFLYMLVEQGWPAMILYAMLICAVFAQAQRTYHRFKDRFYKACTLGLAMMFAACFVNNFFSELIETHKVGALFYLSIALLIILNQKSKEVLQQPIKTADDIFSAIKGINIPPGLPLNVKTIQKENSADYTSEQEGS